MICDAHVHVGYFDRKGHDGPFYYSPRRVCSVLRRCGVDEFIFSSTSMQTRGIVFSDVHREASEVLKICGKRAHPFLWVTKEYLDSDPQLGVLDEDIYEGIKLHGCETPWLKNDMAHDLERVLDIARKKQVPVMVHTGLDDTSHPAKWLKWAQRYPTVRFDFAHGAPFDVIAPCLAAADNVFTDVACVEDENVIKLLSSDYAERVLWGTDFPVLSARAGSSLTDNMRSAIQKFHKYDGACKFVRAYSAFLKIHQS